MPRCLSLLPPELKNRFQVLHFSGREEDIKPLTTIMRKAASGP